MKTSSKLYLFFTSLMFLFAPLALGLAFIYFTTGYSSEKVHLQGLSLNIVFIAILTGIILLLIRRKKLKFPNLNEKKILLFGLLSNIVIFFYVFQQSLEIEKEMTIYLIIFIILLLYFFIIDKKTIIKELWILSIWFLVIDTIHYNYMYIGYGASQATIRANLFITLFYISIPLLGLGLYIYEIKKYKVIDIFSIISIAIVSSTLLLFTDIAEMNSKFIMTINLILPFVIITDFVTMLIYKRFNALKVGFYIRLYTIMVLIFIYSENQYFSLSTYSRENLFEMVGIIYVAVVCNLIVYLIPRKSLDLETTEVEDIEDLELVKESNETLLSIDLNSLTITTLKALAKAKGIEGYTKLDKEDIINLIK